MKIRLIIITPDYPFGERGKYKFLQDEINILNASNDYKLFDEIVIVNIKKNSSVLTGRMPINGKLLTTSNFFDSLVSYSYAFLKLFSKETYEEWKASKTLRYKTSIIRKIRKWIIFYSTYYKIDKLTKHFLKDDHINITYSYWLLEGAYTIAKWKRESRNNIALARCHGVEVRDYETYTPFRNVVDRYCDSISFVAEGKKAEYNRILSNIINGRHQEHNQYVHRLGVEAPKIDLIYKEEKDYDLYVISVSYVTQIKRIDLIIDALALIDDIRIKWVHFGNGKMLTHIKKYAETKLNKKTNIYYEFYGYIENNDLMSFYRNEYVDSIINCSDNEGIPVSLMEAMSFGIIPIARKVGGNGELVINNETGILLPEFVHPENLKEAILKVYYMKKEVDPFLMMKKRTSDYISSDYNSEANYRKFYKHMLSLVEKR